MKATAGSLAATEAPDRSLTSLLLELSKARLTSLVVLTTLVGFYLGSPGPIQGWLLLHTLLGTAVLASGAAALNQWIEREHDGRMRRTASRPVPSGALSADAALLAGGLLAVSGLVYLAALVDLLTTCLGAATLASYLFVYTPLKRITTLNTAIGAIPGALPPLMGWTAARGEITPQGWSLFAILFFWQLPHFLAIAWLYREDYARAGFAMLPVVDPGGGRTGRQTISHTLGLLSVSLFPFVLGLVGPAYVVGALILGIAFLWTAIQFASTLTAVSARRLFIASILYLPLLLGLMVLSKIHHT